MYFIILAKFKKQPTKALAAEAMNLIADDVKEGVKVHGFYFTLGQYDAVGIFEARDEKAAMKMAMRRGDFANTETLVALPLEEVKKIVE